MAESRGVGAYLVSAARVNFTDGESMNRGEGGGEGVGLVVKSNWIKGCAVTRGGDGVRDFHFFAAGGV